MMTSLVNREPAVFLQAVARTCTLESGRGETMVRLKTPKEQQQQPQQPQQQQGGAASRDATAAAAAGEQAPAEPSAAGSSSAAAAAAQTPAVAVRPAGAADSAAAGGNVTPRAGDARDSSAGGAAAVGVKSAAKASRKLVPGSFVEVIDALLDVVLSYQGVPTQQQQQQQRDAAGSTAMELDTAAGAGTAAAAPAADQQQPSGAAATPAAAAAPAPAAAAAAASGQDVAPLPADLLLRKLSPLSREVGIQAMVLRLLADYCLLFSNSVGLLLKRDSECGPADVRVSGHHHHHAAAQQTPGAEGRTPARRSTSRSHSSSGSASGRHSLGGQQQQQQQQQQDPHKPGVVLRHIMRVQLVEQPPAGSAAAGPGVAANASSLLQAVCIRSGEGRRRIINELVATLTNSSSGTSSRTGSEGGAQQQAAGGGAASKLPYVCKPGSPSPAQVGALKADAAMRCKCLIVELLGPLAVFTCICATSVMFHNFATACPYILALRTWLCLHCSASYLLLLSFAVIPAGCCLCEPDGVAGAEWQRLLSQ
jgi:hypothetical protein